MTTPATPSTPAAVVEGVDVDAVAAAVRACPAVEDLAAGAPGELATYLPGRRVIGVRVEPDSVLVQVRSRWGVPVTEVAEQIRRATASLARRRVDVAIVDIGDITNNVDIGDITNNGDPPRPATPATDPTKQAPTKQAQTRQG